jgi:hypothetical protein
MAYTRLRAAEEQRYGGIVPSSWFRPSPLRRMKVKIIANSRRVSGEAVFRRTESEDMVKSQLSLE